jgi:hypothetical protein
MWKKVAIIAIVLVLMVGLGVLLLTLDAPPTVLYNINKTLSVTIGTEEFLNSWLRLEDSPNTNDVIRLRFRPNGIEEREVRISVLHWVNPNETRPLDVFAEELIRSTNKTFPPPHMQYVLKSENETVGNRQAYAYERTVSETVDGQLMEYAETYLIFGGEYYITVRIQSYAQYADAPEMKQVYKVLDTIKEHTP